MRILLKNVIICITLTFLSCVHNRENRSNEGVFVSASSIEKDVLFWKRNISKITITYTEGENGQTEGEIQSLYLPGVIINGIIVDESGQQFFYITGTRLFSEWDNGWTEGFYDASGKYAINKDDTYKLTVIDPYELWDINSGEIRFNDVYFRNDNGMWKVKNRIDRLKELCRALQEDMGQPKYMNPDSQEIYPLLFPEVYNFKKLEQSGKLNKSFLDSNSEPQIIRAFEVNWRSDYTKAVFPKQMWDLRNSGTLYRDTLEAPKIFASLYNIDFFMSEILLIDEFLKVGDE